MAVSGQMDPLDFLTNEELQLFLHRKKTEISCIEQPHAFLTQLRDHDLMPEELFEKVKGMRYREEKQERVYEVLDRLEKEKSQCMHQFWRCVFQDHILQLYPTLQRLRNSLLDGIFNEFYGNSLDVETRTVKSKGKGEKEKERKDTRKRNKDDENGEDSDDPGPSSVSTPTQEKPAKKPSFCLEFYENSVDVETQTEKSEGKEEKGNNTRKRNKNDENGEDSDDPGPSSASTPTQEKRAKKPSLSSPVKKGDTQEQPINCGDKEGTLYWDELTKGTFEFNDNSADVETQMEKSEGTEEKGKERTNTRKRNEDDENGEDSDDPGPSSASIPTREKPSFSYPVNCGDKEGTFYWDKLAQGEKCILSQGCWFTPTAFEKFGGKERFKNWKFSIRCRNTPLKKLIEEDHLQSPPMERRKRICAPKEEMTDLSVFQAPSLPVTCVSLTGTLYKDRFASGSCGKCIRTEESWFTPEEFVKQEPTLTDGHWKKDILCNGKTLNFLLKKEILRIHPLLCKCVKCSHQPEDLMAQNNDDVCYVCESGGDLVCCDECPRDVHAFHSHCHLPAEEGDSPGEWICTFCVLRTSQQWRDSSSMTEQEAFNAPVSQYRLHCHYLLLCVYKEDTQRVFVEDPRKTVSKYSRFISQPMWLDRIKLKLESDEYQTVEAFVSDIQLIFSNCSTFNKNNKFGKMGARLKEMFEKEFQKIFTIQ